MEKEPNQETSEHQLSLEIGDAKNHFCTTIIDILKGGVKNRITLFSYIGLLNFLYFGETDIENYKSLLDSYPILTASIMGLIWTGLGFGTEVAYKRTKEHISKFGKLDERFFIKVAKYYSNNHFIGYCEQQGMYLAAKEFGLGEDFFRLKKKHTKNKVPNF